MKFIPLRRVCGECSLNNRVQLTLQSRRVPKILKQTEESRTLLANELQQIHLLLAGGRTRRFLEDGAKRDPSLLLGQYQSQ